MVFFTENDFQKGIMKTGMTFTIGKILRLICFSQKAYKSGCTITSIFILQNLINNNLLPKHALIRLFMYMYYVQYYKSF